MWNAASGDGGTEFVFPGGDRGRVLVADPLCWVSMTDACIVVLFGLCGGVAAYNRRTSYLIKGCEALGCPQGGNTVMVMILDDVLLPRPGSNIVLSSERWLRARKTKPIQDRFAVNVH